MLHYALVVTIFQHLKSRLVIDKLFWHFNLEGINAMMKTLHEEDMLYL